jgi:hypothetical protein
VHGALQRVSQETAELVRKNYHLFEYPDTPSYTIFCHSIAEGLISVAQGCESEGFYTLISNPAWSWQEVLEHYADPQRPPKVVLVPNRTPWLGVRLLASVQGWVAGLAHNYKDTLRANILDRFPAFERRWLAWFYAKKARSEVKSYGDQFIHRPTGIHEGEIPGRRLPSLSDSRITLKKKEEQVLAFIDGLLTSPSRLTGKTGSKRSALAGIEL